ncbi:MAG: acyl carrier protein [Bryobacteraceae bacterium]
MTRKEFLESVDELMELPAGTLKGDEKLEDLENWNSLAMVGFIGLVDERCDVRLSPRQFLNCSTVNDLLQLAGFAS